MRKEIEKIINELRFGASQLQQKWAIDQICLLIVKRLEAEEDLDKLIRELKDERNSDNS